MVDGGAACARVRVGSLSGRRNTMKPQRVLDLRPTQFAIGMSEVEHKAKKLRRLSRKKMAKYVKQNPVTVVRATDGDLYVIDRHHTLMAYWLVGVKRAPVSVEERLGSHRMSHPRFWRLMSRHHLTHLYDQFGEGPHDPLYLPADIRGLSDDPYRSLAWMAQCKGAFGKSKVRYYEFGWAQLLRRRKLLSPAGRAQLRPALSAAIRLCRSPAARKLPGYFTARSQARG
jgi:hypothetical protein